MTTEERAAYLQHQMRRAPEGSARRIWAAAMLARLAAPAADPNENAGATRQSPLRRAHKEAKP